MLWEEVTGTQECPVAAFPHAQHPGLLSAVLKAVRRQARGTHESPLEGAIQRGLGEGPCWDSGDWILSSSDLPGALSEPDRTLCGPGMLDET